MSTSKQQHFKKFRTTRRFTLKKNLNLDTVFAWNGKYWVIKEWEIFGNIRKSKDVKYLEILGNQRMGNVG